MVISLGRAFVVAGLLLLIGSPRVLSADDSNLVPADVLELVEPHARYRATALAAADDGYGVLVELQKLKVIEPSIVNDRELYDLYMAVIGGERRFPGGEHGKRLQKLIDDNADGLKLFDRFSKFRGVRFPDLFNLPVQELRPFKRIRELQIARLQAQRKFDSAGRWLDDFPHIAAMLQESEGGLLAWLLGVSFEANGLELIARLAADPACPTEQLESWQRRVLDLRKRSSQSLAQCLRRDYFEVQLPPLAKLSADATLEQAVAAVVGQHRPKERKFLLDLRFTLREWQVLALLTDHPTPFDRDETIRLSSERLAEVIRVLEFDRSRPSELDDEELELVAKLWPESIGLDVLSLFPLHLGGPSWDSWEEFWNEIVTAAEASEQLAEIPNVFGKYFIAIHSDWANADTLAGAVVRQRVRVEATLATLAIRRFERLRQRLPKSLHELVDAKLLTKLPRDPIDDQPLRYDSSRRVLWSIGLDGQDNGGVQRFGSSGQLFSMLRKLLPKDDAKKLPPPPEATNKPVPSGNDIVYSLDGQPVFESTK